MANDETKKQVKSTKKNSSTAKEMNELKEKLIKLEGDILYSKAEAENQRKRSLEETEKSRKFAIERFSQEILLVKDSLDAALIIEKATLDDYKNGMELTKKQLIDIFEQIWY